MKDSVHIKRIDVPNSAGLTVWLVDGDYVRDNISVDFIGGGHDLVYDYVPVNEIWIDNGTNKEEIKYYVIHEIYERGIMLDGMGYDEAHEEANEVEEAFRANPGDVAWFLELALAKN